MLTGKQIADGVMMQTSPGMQMEAYVNERGGRTPEFHFQPEMPMKKPLPEPAVRRFVPDPEPVIVPVPERRHYVAPEPVIVSMPERRHYVPEPEPVLPVLHERTHYVPDPKPVERFLPKRKPYDLKPDEPIESLLPKRKPYDLKPFKPVAIKSLTDDTPSVEELLGLGSPSSRPYRRRRASPRARRPAKKPVTFSQACDDARKGAKQMVDDFKGGCREIKENLEGLKELGASLKSLFGG